jgi:hypothetical protein
MGPFVAPVDASFYDYPAFTAFTSILPKEKKDLKIASDVWFCIIRSRNHTSPPTLLKRSFSSQDPRIVSFLPVACARKLFF